MYFSTPSLCFLCSWLRFLLTIPSLDSSLIFLSLFYFFFLILFFTVFLLNTDGKKRVLSSCLLKSLADSHGKTVTLTAAPKAFKSSGERGGGSREGKEIICTGVE